MASAALQEQVLAPRDERRQVRLWGRLDVRDAEPRDIVVQDLSATGFRFESSTSVAIGSAVIVRVGGLPAMAATVTRDASRGYGCRLDTPLDAATLEQVRRNGPFATTPPVATPVEFALPEVERWPVGLRVVAITGGAAACWAAVIGLAWVALG